MSRGDHIYVQSMHRGIPFQHHGIDMGDETVVHLAPLNGSRVRLADTDGEFAVRRISKTDFCRGLPVKVVNHKNPFPGEVIAARAEASIGRQGYHLFDSNCEHFAHHCATGHAASPQIEMGEATVCSLASLATKAYWVMAPRLVGRVAMRSAMKIHPATMLADGVEMAALMTGCHSGLDTRKTKILARVSGTVTAAGVGALVGGPAGAAVSLAAHATSASVGDSLCRSVKKWLAPA